MRILSFLTTSTIPRQRNVSNIALRINVSHYKSRTLWLGFMIFRRSSFVQLLRLAKINIGMRWYRHPICQA